MNHKALIKTFKIIHLTARGNQFLLLFLHKIKKYFFNSPRTLMIHPSYNCSFNCPYCYLPKKSGDCLPLERWMEIITDFKKNGGYSVDFLGGEPLEYAHFAELTNFIISKGLLLNIFTNGENITRKLLETLSPHKDQIIFVVKYDSKECYQKYYNRSLDDLHHKIKLLTEYEFSKMAFVVTTNENADSVNEILENCQRYGLLPIFERYAPVKDQKNNSQMTLSPHKWAKILHELGKHWQEYQQVINSYSIINGSTCSCSSNNIAVMQNGDAKICPEAHNDLNYGNLKHMSLQKVWKQSRKQRKKLLEIPSDCNSCPQKLACRGGCKVYSYQLTGRLDIRDPICTSRSHPTTYPHCAFSILRLIK